MNVLEIIATADPLRTEKSISIELHELNLSSGDGWGLTEISRPTFGLTPRRITAVAAVVSLLAGIAIFAPRNTTTDSTVVSFDWIAPGIAPAAATVNLSKKFAQQTRLAPGETLYLIRESSKFNIDGLLTSKSLTKSWSATNLASVSYVQPVIQAGRAVDPSRKIWTETSQMDGFEPEDLYDFSNGVTPVWERSIPYNDSQVMYRTLVQQSRKLHSSWVTGSEWIAYALNALITSETAAPAQRVMAIAISNALFDQGATNQRWTQTKLGKRIVWIRKVVVSDEINLILIEPEVPGTSIDVTCRVGASGKRTLVEEFRISSWAVVGDLDEEPLASAIQTRARMDLSKL